MRKENYTLAQKAYDVLHDRIAQGHYPLGATLSRRRVAAELEMSVLPVAEALKRLENEGVLETRARIGTRVKIPSPGEVRGLLELREALECESARLFSQRATGQERSEVLQTARELDQSTVKCGQVAQEEAPWPEVRRSDMNLHLRIAECGRSPQLHRQLKQTLTAFWNIAHLLPISEQVSGQTWHQDLVTAISERNADRAEAAMRDHVKRALDDVLHLLHEFLLWDENGLAALSMLRGGGPAGRK